MTSIDGKGNYVCVGSDPAGHGLPAGAYLAKSGPGRLGWAGCSAHDQAYVWKSMNFLSNELNYSQTHAYPELQCH